MSGLRTIIPGSNRRRGYSETTPTSNGPPSPSPVRWTDFARQGLFVQTPGALSPGVSNQSSRPSSIALPSAPPQSAVTGQGMFATNRQVTPRRWTQEDQNKRDEEARSKVMKELVTGWMERLQLISVITTFFAAIEAQLLGIVTPDNPRDVLQIGSASIATLSSALVVHSFAAILSFVAAFFLVRFRVHEANRKEEVVEQKLENGSAPGPEDHKLEPAQTIMPLPYMSIWSANPQLEQVGPLHKGKPPTHLLENCHTLCMILSVAGFVLAMIGTICYIWAMLPRSSKILSTVTIGVSIFASTGALTLPQSFSPLSPSHTNYS